MKNKTKVVYSTIDDSQFDAVETWINSLGLNFNSSRFGEAKRIYEKWCKTWEVPNHEKLWCISELMDLKEFHLWLSNSTFEKKIDKNFLSGTNFLSDEVKTNGRDLIFEIKVASRLKRAGFGIILCDEHDVVVQKGELTLFAECKRFGNFSQMSKRLEYAYKEQLEKLENRKDNGMIFLDFSKVLYKEFIKINSEPVSDMDTLTRWRTDNDKTILNMLEEKHHDILLGIKACIGYYSFPVIVDGMGLVKFNHFFSITSDHSESTSLILRAIEESVGNLCT